MSDNVTDLSELMRIRLEKLSRIEQQGFSWPDRFETTVDMAGFESLPEAACDVAIAGRIVALRSFGKLVFGRLQNITGNMQFALQRETLGDAFKAATDTLDVGDHVGLTGIVMITRTGEKTLDVREWRLLSKSLRPLPEKFHGVADVEVKMRQRYLELISDRESATRFLTRSSIFRHIRRYLEDYGFIEIDTPVLCGSPSGAIARPFATKYDALDMTAFLRIAPETYLKRAVAGGFERVFEFARCFRNEGIDHSHLPDFTMLEFYAAYWNFEDMMRFTKSMLLDLFETLELGTSLRIFETSVDVGSEWRVKDMGEAIEEYTNIDIFAYDDVSSLIGVIRNRSREYPWIDDFVSSTDVSLGKLIDLLFKKACRPHLIDPTFIIHHPIELSPLARRSDGDVRTVDRFQLVLGGWELVNAYSELVHPVDQRRRLEMQASLRASGDDEAMHLDDDFLRCMEYGMPPMSGFGMGMDRLAAILTGIENLRDVTLFPLLKPE